MPAATLSTDGVVFHDLVQQIRHQRACKPAAKRLLISVSGIPGAGKSTFARRLAHDLNAKYLADSHYQSPAGTGEDLSSNARSVLHAYAVDIPMDGFHFDRAKLRSMPDPATAIHRRGAAFTYDAESYTRLVRQLAEPVTEGAGELRAPTFDHAIKDPVQDMIVIAPESGIVILEGNYVNLAREPWSSVADLIDFKLHLVVDRSVAKDRLVKRHVVSGLCEDEASANHRVESTDDLNAEDVLAHRIEGVIDVTLS